MAPELDASEGARMLVCAVEFEVAETRRLELRELLAGNDVVDATALGPQRAGLAVAPDTSRLDLVGGGMLGAGHSVIHRDERVLWLGHEGRYYLDFAAEEIPGCRQAQPVEAIFEGEAPEGGARLVLRGPFDELWIQHLWLDGRDELAPYALAAASVLFGDPVCHEASGYPLEDIARRGVPRRGALYRTEREEQDGRAFARFEATELRLEPFDSGRFVVPPGYRHLRELRGKESDYPNVGGMTDVAPIRWSAEAAVGERMVPGFGPSGGPQIKPFAEPEGEKIEHPRPPPKFQCLPSTHASDVGLLVHRQLLEDLRFVGNLAAKRISAFRGRSGIIDFDWLAQMKAHATSLNMGPGAGVYCLLRDEPPAGNPTGGGHGLLDKLAERVAREHMKDLLGFNPTTLGLSVPDATLIKNLSPNYDAVPEPLRSSFREAVLAREIGRLTFPYEANPTAKLVLEDLLWVELADIQFDIEPRNTEALKRLQVTAAGEIEAELEIPYVLGSAEINHWPSLKYAVLIGLSVGVCIAIPALCWIASLLVVIGIFLAFDLGRVAIRYAPLSVTATLAFKPDTDRVLRPKVTVRLASNSVLAVYTSKVPTPVHQIVAVIITLLMNVTTLTLDQLAGVLSQELTRFLARRLGLGFPASFGQMGFSIAASHAAAGSLSPPAGGIDYLYLQATVHEPPTSQTSPFVTAVEPQGEQALARAAKAFRAADPDRRHYASLSVSQNFLNHYFAGLADTGGFTYTFGTVEAAKLAKLVPLGLPPGSPQFMARLWPAAPPRLQLAPTGATAGRPYLVCFLDDLRLCLSVPADPSVPPGEGPPPERVEILFAAQVPAQIGFGRSPNPVGPPPAPLELLLAGPQLFDLYASLGLLTPGFIDVFDVNSSATPVDLTRTAEYLPLLKAALGIALAPRTDAVVPRRTKDPVTRQAYPLDHKTPDQSNNSIGFQFDAFRGLLHAHLETLLAANLMFNPGVDPNKLTCTQGENLRAF